VNVGIVWALIVGTVLVLIIYGMVSSRLRERRVRRLRREAMPIVEQSVRAGVTYNVQLTNGTLFKSVKLIGLTESKLGQFADFPLESWLVLELESGKRVYVKPASARYFEEL